MSSVYSPARYWREYLRREKQFLDYFEFVPPNATSLAITSPVLADIASNTGNWVESAFDRMVAGGWPFHDPICNIPPVVGDIDEFRQTFENPYRLSHRVVFLKYDGELRMRLTPFQSFSSNVNPEWFRDYSSQKHHRPRLEERMNFQKVAEALAGLFLLSVYPHEMREYLLNEQVINAMDSANDFPNKGQVIRDILLSHPFVLPNEIPSRGVVGTLLAETRLFQFEFPRQLGPDDYDEKEGYLESQWRARGN